MCGICGIVGGVEAPASQAAVRRMMAALQHRGPDDEGLLAAPPVTLGMRRLSIIDLPGGRQPMTNEDGTLTLVFNGEIYNFRELRRELEKRGHGFRTQSDTEVAVHAYEEWGAECLKRLRGMFALAILERPRDGSGNRVFLARDRFGIKPLYYVVVDGTLLFASEVRALLASGHISPRLCRSALRSYLLFGSVGEPSTMLDGVRTLPPGHWMRVSADDPAKLEINPYWELAKGDADARVASPAKNLRSLLEDAVRLHLIADVPLGVFLSSGIDSTALASLAARERGGVHTLTVTFPEREFSEAEIARRTAQKLGATHRELVLSGEEMLARVDEAAAALDQPSMDGVNTYFVSWAARQAGLKVALSGLGGDEVFGGYSTFQATAQAKRVAAAARRVPAGVRTATAPAVARLAGRADAGRKAAAVWQEPDALPQEYFFTRALFTPAQVDNLLNGQPVSVEHDWLGWLESVTRQAEQFDSFTAVSWLESRSYMLNTLLRDTDSMSMAHSLEVRVPFLDHPLIEFMAALPLEEKQRRGVPKSLLIDALGDLLPPDVVNKTKQTFTLPWEHWLRGTLKERITRGLAELAPPLADALDADAVQAVWRDFEARRTSWSRPWSLYVLNEWAKSHLRTA
jgi:asparagine synthase (glutamine-hydrolysing)